MNRLDFVLDVRTWASKSHRNWLKMCLLRITAGNYIIWPELCGYVFGLDCEGLPVRLHRFLRVWYFNVALWKSRELVNWCHISDFRPRQTYRLPVYTFLYVDGAQWMPLKWCRLSDPPTLVCGIERLHGYVPVDRVTQPLPIFLTPTVTLSVILTAHVLWQVVILQTSP